MGAQSRHTGRPMGCTTYEGGTDAAPGPSPGAWEPLRRPPTWIQPPVAPNSRTIGTTPLGNSQTTTHPRRTRTPENETHGRWDARPGCRLTEPGIGCRFRVPDETRTGLSSLAAVNRAELCPSGVRPRQRIRPATLGRSRRTSRRDFWTIAGIAGNFPERASRVGIRPCRRVPFFVAFGRPLGRMEVQRSEERHSSPRRPPAPRNPSLVRPRSGEGFFVRPAGRRPLVVPRTPMVGWMARRIYRPRAHEIKPGRIRLWKPCRGSTRSSGWTGGRRHRTGIGDGRRAGVRARSTTCSDLPRRREFRSNRS